MSAAGLLVLGLIAGTPDDAGAVGLADLGAYQEALQPEAAPEDRAVPVGFRDLWGHPEGYRGRPVRVEGRLMRRFHQGPVGGFPALVEAWAVSPAGDPVCLVYPEPPGGAGAETRPGEPVRFVGTFLRTIRYRGGDVDRLAPLIVGPRPPVFATRAPAEASRAAAPPRPVPDWVVGLAAAAVVVAVLGAQHLRGPLPRRPEAGPRPEFEEEGP